MTAIGLKSSASVAKRKVENESAKNSNLDCCMYRISGGYWGVVWSLENSRHVPRSLGVEVAMNWPRSELMTHLSGREVAVSGSLFRENVGTLTPCLCQIDYWRVATRDCPKTGANL
jgi:hypothetical protein